MDHFSRRIDIQVTVSRQLFRGNMSRPKLNFLIYHEHLIIPPTVVLQGKLQETRQAKLGNVIKSLVKGALENERKLLSIVKGRN